MTRRYAWVGANLGIAFVVAGSGISVAAAFDAEDAFGIADVGLCFLVAAVFVPGYLPTVVLHGAAVRLSSARIAGRWASLLLGPVAPGALWLVSPVFGEIGVAVAVAGSFVYGASARLATPETVRPLLIASVIALALFAAAVGFVLALVPLALAIAVWGFRRQLRQPAVQR